MKCPRCGGDIPAGATSCGSCGARLSVGKRCPHCQNVIPANAVKCPRCGKPVSAPAVSTASQKAVKQKNKPKGAFRWWQIPIALVIFFIGFGIGFSANSNSSVSPSKDKAKSSSKAASTEKEKINLDGTWSQINSNSDTMYQMAGISGDKIEVRWIDKDNDTEYLYWVGSVKLPKNPGNEFTWDSENDISKTSNALMASSDKTKTFTYSDGQISFQVSFMGATTTVKLEKINDSPPSMSESDSSETIEKSTQAPEDNTSSADIPKEYLNALSKAKSYSDNMAMSKQSIYDQLISEYGENFPAEAAQYAIDNLDADYKANALRKAKSYYENMEMSKEAVRDQLTSEYGEKFTQEEADYAIENLE